MIIAHTTRRNPARIIELDIPLPDVGVPFLRRVVAAAASVAGASRAVMIGRSRENWLVPARHCGMWIAYHATARSLPEIGRAFCRDHSSVISGIRTVDKRLAGRERVETRRVIADIVRHLKEPPPQHRLPAARLSTETPSAQTSWHLDDEDEGRLKAEPGSRRWFLENDASFRQGLLGAHPELQPWRSIEVEA